MDRKTFLHLARRYWFIWAAALAFIAGLIFPGQNGDTAKTGVAGEKNVRLVYVNWAEGIAMTYLAQEILEDEMGYDVTMTMADPAPLFTSLANGDNDVFLDAWLPVTHGDYIDEYGDQVNDLGYNYEGARIGLVTPQYVQVDAIPQLPEHRDLFDGKIVGIDSGAGIMRRTDKAIEAYELDYNLMASSGPAMTTSLKSAIEGRDPIVVTGWRPHWMFARWELKFLKDPKGVYGQEENLHTITRRGLAQDMPLLVDFLKNFKLNDRQLGGLMGAINESQGNPAQAAREWMDDHQSLVQSWLPREIRQKGSD
jgi:glycine betaine/proline transport system substrate-binding protein